MILFLAMLVASLLLDAAVWPRTGYMRRWQGIVLHLLVMTAMFGFCLAVSGNAPVAAVLATALMGLFTVASNAKHKMLGEPLVFSDLALIVGIFRHPRFYFTAISAPQRWMLGIGTSIALVVLVLLSSAQLHLHLVGAGLLLFTSGTLASLLGSRWFDSVAQTPDLANDLSRYGLIATLLLYWRRWRRMADPQPCPALRAISDVADPLPPELIVIVQCESFADPVDLTGEARCALPGLTSARAAAWQWGELDVSGFGAYTMRTEYGVLFGRSEAALGFRRYDPFLSAHGESSYALSARLRGAGYQCSFVHPHDMRFYSRDRLMPAIGFDRLIGEEGIAPILPDGGRYVDDRTLGASLIDLVDKAMQPTLIYAVTMENHGPWDSDNARDARGRLEAYLRHLQSSDAMLSDLIARLSRDGRPALLVFFGDHRPSIPGVTAPGGARHTPYVIVRFDSGGPVSNGGAGRVDLSPAALHHAILRCVRPDAEPADAIALNRREA
ncbi:LTA synthase family protein [Sphingomonas sp. QA11]|uniref:LTA synthase family protein n=1 Tax=Sphingomonas sp. QA11 TaxID=2950605 RepID=UPI00234BEEFF|nr:LTA synthase family protein [Sphingomonas sp. QA11]WCM25701.1 LTA synthase family protein [Sphingomonas sp. QA11]